MSRQDRIKQYREAAVKRQNGKCMYCFALFTKENKPTAEHIIPRSKGGKDMPHNIGAACKSCNKARSNYKVTPGTLKFLKERPDLNQMEFAE